METGPGIQKDPRRVCKIQAIYVSRAIRADPPFGAAEFQLADALRRVSRGPPPKNLFFILSVYVMLITENIPLQPMFRLLRMYGMFDHQF